MRESRKVRIRIHNNDLDLSKASDSDDVNLWPAWVGIETAIFCQCSPGTVETQRRYPLRHGPRGLLGQKRGAIDNNYGRQ